MKKILCLFILVVFSNLSVIYAVESTKSTTHLTAQQRYERRLQEVLTYNAYVERYMTRDISHRIGLWGQVGYSSIHAKDFNAFSVSNKGNIGGGIGIGYQLRYKKLLAQTGLELQFYNSKWILYSDDPNQPQLSQNYSIQLSSPNGMVDAWAIYHYANPTERVLIGYFQVPLLAGMEFFNHQMYFLAGPKIGFNVLRQTQLKTDASLSIIDPELIDPLTEMPTHNLTTKTMSQKISDVQFGINVSLSAEIGMSLDKYYQHTATTKNNRKTNAGKQPNALHTRLAVFAEYGVANINTNQARKWELPFSDSKIGNPIDLNQLQICSSIQTSSAAHARIHPWMVGVKVCIMYDLPRKQLRTKTLPKAPQPQLQPQPQPQPQPESEVFTYEEQKVTVGMNVKIENLFFATNKTEVLPESEPALEQLYEFLRDNPQINILLIGHTDSIGSDRDNQILSEGRANNIRNEMVIRGISTSRIQVEGRGETQPVDTNSTEEGRQNNRRVEFTIIKVDNE